MTQVAQEASSTIATVAETLNETVNNILITVPTHAEALAMWSQEQAQRVAAQIARLIPSLVPSSDCPPMSHLHIGTSASSGHCEGNLVGFHLFPDRCVYNISCPLSHYPGLFRHQLVEMPPNMTHHAFTAPLGVIWHSTGFPLQIDTLD